MGIRGKVNDYRELKIWQIGIELAKSIYSLTQNSGFPAEEKFGVISQMRRAAVSVPSNIAEGQARNSTKDFIRFLYISKGSLAELDTQLIIACELKNIKINEFNELTSKIDELQRMIFTLVSKLGQTR